MRRRNVSLTVFIALALAVAVGLATAASPFASASPDGLTRVAADKGFVDSGRLHSVQEDSPLPGYALPGIGNEKLAKGLAGFVGTLAVFGLGLGVASVLRRTRRLSPRAPAAT
jgi:hypothetical protein